MSPETALCSEPLAADVAVEGSVFQPLNLRLVITKVLLQVGQLDERSPTLRNVTFVGALSWNVIIIIIIIIIINIIIIILSISSIIYNQTMY